MAAAQDECLHLLRMGEHPSVLEARRVGQGAYVCLACGYQRKDYEGKDEYFVEKLFQFIYYDLTLELLNSSKLKVYELHLLSTEQQAGKKHYYIYGVSDGLQAPYSSVGKLEWVGVAAREPFYGEQQDYV